MRQRLIALLLLASCTLLLNGCTASLDEEQTVNQPSAPAQTESGEPGKENISSDLPAYPSEDAGSVMYQSSLGYSCKYDPTVFTLDDTGDGDVFVYQTAENLDAPVYASVQLHEGMSAEEILRGLMLQHDAEDDDVQDIFFGADGIGAKLLSSEEDVNGVEQIQMFYLIPSGANTLLVELGGYDGMPDRAEHKLQEIAETFALLG